MIKYLLKFVSRKEYAEKLQSGYLYMRPALYYHELEGGQGDETEGATICNLCMFKNHEWLIFCMYCVDSSDIIDGIISIPKRCIEEFCSSTGYIVALDFSRFESVLSNIDTEGYELYAGRVQYRKLTMDETTEIIKNDSPVNLFVKRPFYYYQKEYRIVIPKTLPKNEHKEYRFSLCSNDQPRIIPVSTLKRRSDVYLLNLEGGDGNV